MLIKTAPHQNCALSPNLKYRKATTEIQANRANLLSRTTRIIFYAPHTISIYFFRCFSTMVRIADNVITGADRRLMLYFYYSPVSGKNIVRRFTSLTGERVKKEAAFKGFRESGNRMKEASPIAASLYKMVPAEIKQYALYRILTGEALKMLKTGSDPETISKTLKEIHIDPLIREPEKERISIKRERRENQDNGMGISNITKYFQIKPNCKSRIRRWRRHCAERLINNPPEPGGNHYHSASNLSKKATMLLAENETIHLSEKGTTPRSEQTTPQSNKVVVIKDQEEASPLKQSSKFSTKYPELMYRGRLRECKRLRLYIRSSHFPGVSL
jgi:hypothetical protein